jgi:hypothetical protein
MRKCGGDGVVGGWFMEVYDDGLGEVQGLPCANTPFFGNDLIQGWNLYP